MGWDGSGGYNRQRNFSADASAGIKILASAMDQELNDVASAITIAWARDGQNTPTADIPLGGYRIINGGQPASATDYIRVKEVIENVPIYMIDTATSSDRVSVSAQFFTNVSAGGGPADGAGIIVQMLSNKSAAVMHLDGFSANIINETGARVTNSMVSGGVYQFIYRSADTAWQVLNPSDGYTALEITAGLSVSDPRYPEGHLFRYGVTNSSDMTDIWNPLLTTGGFSIYVPAGQYYADATSGSTNGDGIRIGSNTHIFHEPGVTITIPTGGMSADRGFMRMVDTSSIFVEGNDAIYQYQTKPTSSEYRHMWDIRGARNVELKNLRAVKSGGDGYFIGQGTSAGYCEDVTLINCKSDNCRRQGISIVSGKNIKVLGGNAKNITGTAPQCGMDIEPDSNADTLQNIYVENFYTENCAGGGMKVDLHSLPGSADKTIGIKIVNCSDQSSQVGFFCTTLNLDGNNVAGEFVVEDYQSEGPSATCFHIHNYDALGPRIKLIRPKAIRPNQNGASDVSLGAAFNIYAAAAATGGPANIGGVDIHDPYIRDPDGNVTNYFFIKDQRSASADEALNVNIFGAIDAAGQASVDKMIDMFGAGIIEDLTDTLKYNATATFNLDPSNYVRTVTNSGAAGTVEVDLDNVKAMSSGTRVAFEVVTSGQILRIDPDVSADINPGSLGVGKYVQASSAGAYIEIEKVSDTLWKVRKEIGTWSREA